ncbi:uncharacterized protein UHOD_03280 [Ustilago sp. UG-2017b]|nr:uncharacterized protein UHOD_03280 [Ustilago sp. UG-2017b]
MSSSTAQQPVQDTNFASALSDDASGQQNGRQHYGSLPTTSPSEALSAPKPTAVSTRAIAPDLLRGLILPLMSLDHAALFMGAWLHGTPRQTENAGTPMHEWNFTSAYVSRTITHLCAPGFFFLMGMGTVYFHKSRKRIGWGEGRMVKHFVIRAVALTLVSEVMGETLMWGRGVWLINIVLIGLAVDYLLTGLLCVMLEETDKLVLRGLDKLSAGKADGQRRPLLDNANAEQQNDTPAASPRSQSLSFWIHNVLLLILTYITIFWNIWLPPTHGHCSATATHPSSSTPIELLALQPLTSASPPPPPSPSSAWGPWFDFWFYPVQNRFVMSGFPPLAWLSFSIFGLLYARVMLYKKWSPSAVIVGNLFTAVILSALFVATRLLHFGNLSEGCLHMPEHLTHPDKNQYLVSIRSFFYITKYPPSPSFFALTMAVNFALLAFFSTIPPTIATKIPGLMNYGGSALFFYVAHMYLYALLSIPARHFFEHDLPDHPPNNWEKTKGLGPTAPFWITWVLGLVILSPLCRLYGKIKATKGPDSLWRFF